MEEKVAVVTGASRGIGRAIALELAEKGYKVILNYCGSKVRAEQAAEEICAAIRECIKEVYDEATAEAIRIQYGGSMNAGNAAELLAKPDIDGGLVGGASLKPDFGKIVNYNK